MDGDGWGERWREGDEWRDGCIEMDTERWMQRDAFERYE